MLNADMPTDQMKPSRLVHMRFNSGHEAWLIRNWPNHAQCTDAWGCKTHIYVKDAAGEWSSSYWASDHQQHSERILGTDGLWHDQTIF
jgi:hypothetical protein